MGEVSRAVLHDPKFAEVRIGSVKRRLDLLLSHCLTAHPSRCSVNRHLCNEVHLLNPETQPERKSPAEIVHTKVTAFGASSLWVFKATV